MCHSHPPLILSSSNIPSILFTSFLLLLLSLFSPFFLQEPQTTVIYNPIDGTKVHPPMSLFLHMSFTLHLCGLSCILRKPRFFQDVVGAPCVSVCMLECLLSSAAPPCSEEWSCCCCCWLSNPCLSAVTAPD